MAHANRPVLFRSRRRASLIALGAIPALVLAGCSSSPMPGKRHANTSHTQSHAKTTTPTTQAATTTSTTAAGAPAPPCSGSNLKGSEATFAAAAGGAAKVVVALTNSSKTACSLTGYPKLQLLDAKGNDLPTTVDDGGSGIPSSDTVVTANLAAKGGQASFLLYWVASPSSSEPTCTMAPEMKVTVPGSTKTITMPAEINACGGIVQTSPFEPGITSTG